MSWVFLFVGLIATISIRLVNFILHLNIVWAKVCWYIGVIGFTLYFVYKFIHYKALQKEIDSYGMLEKLSCKEKLGDADYDVLRSILCGFTSKESSINYFFIFLTSAIALIVGVFQDFFF